MLSPDKGIRTEEEYQLCRIVGKGHFLHTTSQARGVGGGPFGVLVGGRFSCGVGSSPPPVRFAGGTPEALTNVASRSGMMKVMYISLFDDKRIVVETSPLAS